MGREGGGAHARTTHPMQATRRRTQVERDLQLSSTASGRARYAARGGVGAASEEAGGDATNPSPPAPTARGEAGSEESEWDSAVDVGVGLGLGEGRD